MTNAQPVDILGVEERGVFAASAEPSASDGEPAAAGAPPPVAWRSSTWDDVRVGDVVRVNNREAFPADLLLLRSSSGGQCWVRPPPPSPSAHAPQAGHLLLAAGVKPPSSYGR